MKFSDTQFWILSSASQRGDHAAVLPANLKGSAAKKVVDRLLKEKLLQEFRSQDDMPVWRRDDDKPYSLRITRAGLKALEGEEVAKASGNSAAAHSNEVVATNVSTAAKSAERPSRANRGAKKKTAAVSAKATKPLPNLAKSDSKQDKIVTLLERPKGVTLDALVKETQWQKHSVRGFLAGTVRKKLKLSLLSEKVDGVRTYRIGTGKAGKSKRTSVARKA